jgi:hypothetical protein
LYWEKNHGRTDKNGVPYFKPVVKDEVA